MRYKVGDGFRKYGDLLFPLVRSPSPFPSPQRGRGWCKAPGERFRAYATEICEKHD